MFYHLFPCLRPWKAALTGRKFDRGIPDGAGRDSKPCVKDFSEVAQMPDMYPKEKAAGEKVISVKNLSTASLKALSFSARAGDQQQVDRSPGNQDPFP